MRRSSWQGSIRSHKGRLLLRVKNEAGDWVERSSGFADTPENLPKAEALLAQVRAKMRAHEDATDGEGGALTVKRWGERWMRSRKTQVRDWKNDASRLTNHVYPAIGHMRLDEVRPRHLVELVAALRASPSPHAPRTVRNIYSVVKSLYRDARIADVLPGADPCILTHRQLGKVRDAKTGWRAGAVFTREELVALISDPRIPEDRRLSYALLGLGMLRLGEMAGLTWAKVQPAEPLARLQVDASYEQATKGQNERWMPIHPTLAAMLAEWRLAGWARAFGRPPTAADLVLPVTAEPARKGRRVDAGNMRDRHYVWKRAQRDMEALGLRARRVHDLRRTGISLAQDDGADRSILRWGTHAPPREVFDLYTSLHWETVSREVAKLRIVRPTNLWAASLGSGASATAPSGKVP